ncbi:MAG: YdcF family protein [Acidobacteria bacterium]|nr:YdcF family protein [Acidobacteriota bacterium]
MLATDSRRASGPRRRRRSWLWRGIVAVLLLGPVLLYLAREPLLTAAARALTIDDAEAPADYLVVLGGGAETRPFAAAELYRKRFAPRVVIFEHKTDRITDLGLTPTHDQLYRKVLELEGVAAEAIVRLPGAVDSSWDEARSLQRLLASHPARRVVLVTSAEHTRRARWVFRKVLDGTPVQVRMAPARHLTFDETNWWKQDEGALAYLHEYLKLPFYWIRYVLSDEQAHDASGLPIRFRERGAE